MRTKGAVAAVIAAGALLVTLGCAKDETVATTPTTPVTALSSGSDTEKSTTTTTEDEGGDVGAGAYDEACSIIEEIDEVQGNDVDEAIDLMEDARGLSPDELAGSWDELIDAMESLAAVEGDPEAEDAVLADMLADPDFLDAAAEIDDFAEEECGLDIELDPEDEAEEPGPRGGDDEIGVPDDGSEDPTSVQAVKAYMAEHHGDEVWWPVLEDASGWSWTHMVDPMWTITLSASSDWDTLTTAELEAACDALAEHLDTIVDSDPGVEILDPDDEVLVSRFFRGEACAPEGGF